MPFIVQHARELKDGQDEVKVIGVYSSYDLAATVVEEYQQLPGFDSPEGRFFISEYQLDKDHWAEGFVYG